MKKSVDDKEISTKLRKNKLNAINLKDSNLPSTISDSKLKEKNNKVYTKTIKPKTATNRNIEKIKLKGNQIKKIKIENDNNIKFLKDNLKKLNTEGDIVENKITNIKEIEEINNNNNTSNNRNYFILKEQNQNQIKEITNINNSINNNKNIENKCLRIIKKRISSYKKDKPKTHNNKTYLNLKTNISSFDKRKKYIVPMIKHKKKKKKENKKVEKKKYIEKGKKIIENKEILTSNLIKNKQIEYLRDYQKYMDEFNNKLYKDNEKKFRFIQQEGFELDEIFLDDDENMNDTIDEINEKEEEGEGDENQESI